MAKQECKVESMAMSNLKDFYKGKRVFVTGHTGFKGSWLMAILEQWECIAKGYALPPQEEQSFYSCLFNNNSHESVFADIRNCEILKKELQEFSPDIIFHLAAQPLVRESYNHPTYTFDVNVVGTSALLEASLHLNKKLSIVIVTTDKVYENAETGHLFQESDRLGGHDPYSASKACAELVVSSFRNSFFRGAKQESVYPKKIASARAGNVIGGGDWSKDRIIPDAIRALSSKQTIIVRNPTSVRPWQHVIEPLCGYLMLGMKLFQNDMGTTDTLNFGPSQKDHLTVQEVVELAISEWGEGNWLHEIKSGQPHEAGLLKLDISQAAKELGWIPKLDSKTAIQWTIEWYKAPDTLRKDITHQQIKRYFGC